jgi:hypothetical protein
MKLSPKQIRIIYVLLYLLAGPAAWFELRMYFAIHSAAGRVVILAAGTILWFSVFEVVSAISLKRKFSAARVLLVLVPSILFFGLTELFLLKHPEVVLILYVIAVIVSLAMMQRAHIPKTCLSVSGAIIDAKRLPEESKS